MQNRTQNWLRGWRDAAHAAFSDLPNLELPTECNADSILQTMQQMTDAADASEFRLLSIILAARKRNIAATHSATLESLRVLYTSGKISHRRGEQGDHFFKLI